MKKKVKSTNVGDVFKIEIKENLYCYGQIVSKGNLSDTIIIYDKISSNNLDLDEIINNKIIFYVNTVDEFITNGRWMLIGKACLPDNLKYREYITDIKQQVLSQEGKVIRSASRKDIKELTSYISYSPIMVEDAVKAKYGDDNWYSALDDILYKE